MLTRDYYGFLHGRCNRTSQKRNSPWTLVTKKSPVSGAYNCCHVWMKDQTIPERNHSTFFTFKKKKLREEMRPTVLLKHSYSVGAQRLFRKRSFEQIRYAGARSSLLCPTVQALPLRGEERSANFPLSLLREPV